MSEPKLDLARLDVLLAATTLLPGPKVGVQRFRDFRVPSWPSWSELHRHTLRRILPDLL